MKRTVFLGAISILPLSIIPVALPSLLGRTARACSEDAPYDGSNDGEAEQQANKYKYEEE